MVNRLKRVINSIRSRQANPQFYVPFLWYRVREEKIAFASLPQVNVPGPIDIFIGTEIFFVIFGNEEH